MNPFTYTDIFATKGTEYLVIIAFLLLLIPFRMLLNRGTTRQISPERSPGKLFNRLPKGIYFSSNHLWAFLEPRGTVKLGPDEFLIRAIGSAGIHFTRSAGEEIKKGELLAEIRHDGKALKLRSPIDGRIAGINADVALVSSDRQDLYSDGWIVKMEPENWKSATGSFFLAYEAVEFMKAEIARLRDFLQVQSNPSAGLHSLPLNLQDGGEPVEEFLSLLPAESWNEFERTFLELDDR